MNKTTDETFVTSTSAGMGNRTKTQTSAPRNIRYQCQHTPIQHSTYSEPVGAMPAYTNAGFYPQQVISTVQVPPAIQLPIAMQMPPAYICTQQSLMRPVIQSLQPSIVQPTLQQGLMHTTPNKRLKQEDQLSYLNKCPYKEDRERQRTSPTPSPRRDRNRGRWEQAPSPRRPLSSSRSSYPPLLNQHQQQQRKTQKASSSRLHTKNRSRAASSTYSTPVRRRSRGNSIHADNNFNSKPNCNQEAEQRDRDTHSENSNSEDNPNRAHDFDQQSEEEVGGEHKVNNNTTNDPNAESESESESESQSQSEFNQGNRPILTNNTANVVSSSESKSQSEVDPRNPPNDTNDASNNASNDDVWRIALSSSPSNPQGTSVPRSQRGVKMNTLSTRNGQQSEQRGPSSTPQLRLFLKRKPDEEDSVEGQRKRTLQNKPRTTFDFTGAPSTDAEDAEYRANGDSNNDSSEVSLYVSLGQYGLCIFRESSNQTADYNRRRQEGIELLERLAKQSGHRFHGMSSTAHKRHSSEYTESFDVANMRIPVPMVDDIRDYIFNVVPEGASLTILVRSLDGLTTSEITFKSFLKMVLNCKRKVNLIFQIGITAEEVFVKGQVGFRGLGDILVVPIKPSLQHTREKTENPLTKRLLEALAVLQRCKDSGSGSCE